MARELSVLVACGDDGDALRALVDRTQRTLARCGLDGEIVLVADGSRAVDEVVDDLAAAHANVVALHHDGRRGRLASWHSALGQSSGRTVCTLEPGAGHRPEAIAQLYRELSAMRAEVVQGTRAPLASSRPAWRWYLERALDRVVGVMLGVRGSDVRSRFVLTTRDVLGDVLGHVEPFAEAPGLMTAAAALRGYGIRQVETAYDVDALEPELDTVGALLRGAVALRRQTRVPSRRATAVQLDELRSSQWLDGEALRALQRERLEALLRHAARHVEYYRARLDRLGLSDDDAPMLVDLAELPLLERATLAEDHGLTLVSASRDPARVRRVVTAGARGELLEVFVDEADAAARSALEARHLEWAGLRAGGLHVRLSFGTPEQGRLVDARRRLAAARGRPVTLPIGVGDVADVDVAIARLAQLEPAVLEGSAEALILIASRGARLRGGTVVSHGQTLDVALRARLEQALGVPVFDRYGTRELGTVAQECPAHAGLHVNVETHVVEVLSDGRAVADGEEGEVVVTALGNRVVPLLRYRIGDRAMLLREPCACGRAAPRLVGLRGREPSFVRAAGRSVPAGVLDELFRSQIAVLRRFQVEQQADGRVLVRVVRRPGFSAVSEALLRGGLRAVLGDATPSDVVHVEWLAPDARAYVSRLAEGACPQLPLPL